MELISREEMARDSRLVGVMRMAHHGQGRGYSEWLKKLTEGGS